MVVFRPKTSPASEIFSDDGFAIARRSEEFGLSRTEHKNPTRLRPSINSVVDFGYTAVDLISLSEPVAVQ
jgi:hypothetical protein